MAIMTRLPYATAIPSGVDTFFSPVSVSFLGSAFALPFAFSNTPFIASFTESKISSAITAAVIYFFHLRISNYIILFAVHDLARVLGVKQN